MRRWIELVEQHLEDTVLAPRPRTLALLVILFGCAAARLLVIESPALDRTAWKEIDYLAVSTNFWQHGRHLFYPEISWPAEGPRFTAMELPLVPYLAASFYSLLGYSATAARLPTLLAALVMGAYVYLLARRSLGAMVGLCASLAAGIMSLAHPFGHYLFSDPAMIALTTMTLYHYQSWLLTRRHVDAAIFTVALSLTILIKLEALYLGLLLLGMTVSSLHTDLRRYLWPAAMAALALVPVALWYRHAYWLGRTSLDVFGVVGGLRGGGHNKFQTLTLLRHFDWYHEMYWRIGHSILGGYMGMALCALGVAMAIFLRRGRFFFAYVATIFVYFAVVAEGQIDAPYRQLALVPAIAPFVALGAVSVVALLMGALAGTLPWARSSRVLLPVTLLLICLADLRGLWRGLLVAPEEPVNATRWRLAQYLRAVTNPRSKLITLGEYSIHVGGNDLSPMLYHYSGLTGWSLERGGWSEARVEELIGRGATHLLGFQMRREPDAAPFIQALRQRYPVVYEDDDGFILQLR